MTLTQAVRKALSQEVLVKLKFKKLMGASQGDGRRECSAGRESRMFADPRVGGRMAFMRS